MNPPDPRFVGPTLTPGGVYDVTVTNPSGLTGTIKNGYVSRFLDVPKTASSTCPSPSSSPVASRPASASGNFGPNNNVTRQQMAVFVLKAKHGACYTPPACTQVFNDVPCGTTFAAWVNQFAAEGISGDAARELLPAQPGPARPDGGFLLKGKYGSTFTPAT